MPAMPVNCSCTLSTTQLAGVWVLSPTVGERPRSPRLVCVLPDDTCAVAGDGGVGVAARCHGGGRTGELDVSGPTLGAGPLGDRS